MKKSLLNLGLIIFIFLNCHQKDAAMEEFVKAVEKGDITLKDEKRFFPWEDVLNCKNDTIRTTRQI